MDIKYTKLLDSEKVRLLQVINYLKLLTECKCLLLDISINNVY